MYHSDTRLSDTGLYIWLILWYLRARLSLRLCCTMRITVVAVTALIDYKIDSVLEREVRNIVEEIVFIDKRLAELGDGDEDMAEKIVLRILRRHLVSDLREIAGFTGEYGYDSNVEASRAYASVEA